MSEFSGFEFGERQLPPCAQLYRVVLNRYDQLAEQALSDFSFKDEDQEARHRQQAAEKILGIVLLETDDPAKRSRERREREWLTIGGFHATPEFLSSLRGIGFGFGIMCGTEKPMVNKLYTGEDYPEEHYAHIIVTAELPPFLATFTDLENTDFDIENYLLLVKESGNEPDYLSDEDCITLTQDFLNLRGIIE